MDKDVLTLGLAEGVRIYVACTTKLTQEVCRRHGCSHVAAAALGRAMCGALLLSATMKDGERVALRFKGDGPIGEVVADAQENLVRGYVGEPDIYLPLKADGHLDVGGAIGRGTLTVTRYYKNAAPFTGYTELVSGEVAEDITKYLYTSEQTPSAVGLGVLVNPSGVVRQAGGYFIQALPDCPEAVLDKLDANIRKAGFVTRLLEKGLTTEDMIKELGEGLDVKILETREVGFKCRCSRERIKEMLKTLSRYDLDELANDETTEVVCPFCNERYQFARDEIKRLNLE